MCFWDKTRNIYGSIIFSCWRSFQVHDTRFEDRGDVDILLVGLSFGLFQDCQFFSHTAVYLTYETEFGLLSIRPDIVPEVRIANSFLSKTYNFPEPLFYWVLDSITKVLVRMWNSTIYDHGGHYTSGHDYNTERIEIMETCFASGMTFKNSFHHLIG